jgi:sugar phosphate isomerase/epimerase
MNVRLLTRCESPSAQIDRRNFVVRTSALGIALSTGANLLADGPAQDSTVPGQKDQFCAFTESFQVWRVAEVCKRFKAIGLDGLDLTVRPGGHIEPGDAPKQLPSAVKTAGENGVKILMLSTAIDSTDRVNEELVAVAGQLGVDRIKLGYFFYKEFGSLRQQIDDVGRRLDGIVRMCRKYNVRPCVHIHSGKTIPSGGAVAYMLLRNRRPEEVGAYVDPMHMTLEGGIDGWRQGLDLLAPWVAISSLKNASWMPTERDKNGQQLWTTKKCPVADGIAVIPEYLAALKQLGFHGLYTLHSEYQGSGSWRDLNADECLKQTEEDFKFVRQFFAA